MAYPSSFVLMFSLLYLTTFIQGSVHGLLRNGSEIETVSKIKVSGRLVCSVSGNFEPSYDCLGVEGANVTLSCSRSDNQGKAEKVRLANVSTNVTGVFDIVLASKGLEFDPSMCMVSVKLPISSCKLFPPRGYLRAPLLIQHPKVITSRFGKDVGEIALFTNGIFKTFFDNDEWISPRS